MRSGSEGCAPRATPCASASSTVLRITCGSPPWKPHATLAELMSGMIASSAPSVQRPYDSPMSQLRSMALRAAAEGEASAFERGARVVMAALPEHAAESFHEAVDVGVGHGQRAGAEAALREEHPLVDQAEESARGRLRVIGPGRAIVAELLLGVV